MLFSLAHVTPHDAILVSVHDLFLVVLASVLVGLVLGVRLVRRSHSRRRSADRIPTDLPKASRHTGA